MVHVGRGVLRGALSVRGTRFAWGRCTYVMGIVNVTPDSFSGDGRAERGGAIEHALAQAAAGADILDIGGESTRPGHERVSDADEIARVVPVIEAVRNALPERPISVDSYKPAVIRAAHAAGADLVNSVWGVPDDVLDALVECEMPVVIMHNQPDTSYAGPVADEVLQSLDKSAARAAARGVSRDRIILDPGIGFGKTADQNIAVLRSLDRLVELGFPTLIGTSRKSTIGKLTGRAPHERICGTVATIALAVAAGVDIVRVHDVPEARDAVAVSDAIVRNWRPTAWTG